MALSETKPPRKERKEEWNGKKQNPLCPEFCNYPGPRKASKVINYPEFRLENIALFLAVRFEAINLFVAGFMSPGKRRGVSVVLYHMLASVGVPNPQHYSTRLSVQSSAEGPFPILKMWLKTLSLDQISGIVIVKNF